MDVKLNLINYSDHLNTSLDTNGNSCLFDPIRKKSVRALPEEIVRQLCLYYLIYIAKYPQSRIQVEKSLLINGVKRRYDIIIYDWSLEPMMLVECKSYKVNMSQAVFDQVALYNLKSNAPYLWVTNGNINYISLIDAQIEKGYQFLDSLPLYVK